MGDVSRELKILRKEQKETLKINNTVREMKNAFAGLIGRLETAKEESLKLRICQ